MESDQVTREEQVIRDDMERTRESLTNKLEALESKILGSVEDATSAVRETVTTVKDTMHEGVESVKDAVDIPAHVDRHPWLMFGGAIAGGYVLASLLLSRERGAPRERVAESRVFPPAIPAPAVDRASAPAGSAKTDSIFGAFEHELKHLKGLAVGVALGTVRELVAKEVPPQLGDQLREIVDSVTRKVGGEPIAAADLPFQEANSCK